MASADLQLCSSTSGRRLTMRRRQGHCRGGTPAGCRTPPAAPPGAAALAPAPAVAPAAAPAAAGDSRRGNGGGCGSSRRGDSSGCCTCGGRDNSSGPGNDRRSNSSGCGNKAAVHALLVLLPGDVVPQQQRGQQRQRWQRWACVAGSPALRHSSQRQWRRQQWQRLSMFRSGCDCLCSEMHACDVLIL